MIIRESAIYTFLESYIYETYVLKMLKSFIIYMLIKSQISNA
ncbi:conserved hypothetical protein [Xenorhabdus nematophila F1]|uniref:Uncharacterized protein n=1 Tax=Xenorhabdus nematophila (strain ATCC 19061 / DSM 3370 / CCUG 14189 / LMG 1036 / NCIMB 9965 / AN6) TaxID=406817 RepID=D3VA85_XENNA|nr:hypothetical protein XNC1_3618 [Xenorhabdus nematophila ATCC 19061]CCW32931.1 conserved hypothetical protein [Xenorhabdus nematophila F1]CEF28645.1 hypothetical protein XNW1_1270015 [Xenorhabdus nematophila str. Websteri]CEK24471.1 hypothetical protein XNC2_3477 [Xenorhabdus nematophila AN6/1]